ncbi:MAG: ELM1/GtrOC1 family putative glycosyltransferase [Filomicrobium sp.]
MSHPGTQALAILLLSDGRPGHFVLSEGIVAALGRLKKPQVKRLDVKRPAWMPARVLSWLVNVGLPPTVVLRFIYGISPSALGNPDIVVSAGGNTLAANIAAARIAGAPNIFYGSLRRYRASDFALVMTSYARDADAPNRMMWLKPTRLDPDAFAPDDSHETKLNDEMPLGLIIGGDSGTISYSGRDWDRLLGFVEAHHTATGQTWFVANAPRTPDVVSDRIAALAGPASGAIQRFIDVRTAGPGTLGILLGNCQAVLCTADSSTMLSETVWMRRRVIAIEPLSFALPSNEASYRDWLEESGWVRRMAIADLTPDAVTDALAGLSPLEANPLDALADELRRRFPDLLR